MKPLPILFPFRLSQATLFLFALLWVFLLPSATAQRQLPVVYISTPGAVAVMPFDGWVNRCTFRLLQPSGSVDCNDVSASIRLRGNSTKTKPKKPYAIRFEQKKGLLGMSKARRWVLLANFMDHSLLRNHLALSAARLTQMEWTPNSRLVDLVVNGEPQGCYLLCEQIREGKNKVDVRRKGGCFFEVDAYPDSAAHFTTSVRRLPVNVKWPKRPSARMLKQLNSQLNQVDERLYHSPSSISNILHIHSFVDWWLLYELTQNAEPNGPRSCFMYKKKKNGKLYAGPVWDFDLAYIDVGVDKGGDLRPSRLNRTDVRRLTADSLYNTQALWFDCLLRQSSFRQAIVKRWCELEPQFRQLADSIAVWRERMEPSARINDELWGGKDPVRFDTCSTFQSSVAHLKQVYLYRIRRLNTLLTSPQFIAGRQALLRNEPDKSIPYRHPQLSNRKQ